MTNTNKGFTFIELIIYVLLITIFVGGIVMFGWDILYGRIKLNVQQAVSENIRFAIKRITYEIKNASDINSVNTSAISLANTDSARNPTIIDIANNRLRIGYGSGGPCPTTNPCYLTDNNVHVTNLTFQNLSTGQGLNTTKNIYFTITVEGSSTGTKHVWLKSKTLQSTAEIRSN